MKRFIKFLTALNWPLRKEYIKYYSNLKKALLQGYIENSLAVAKANFKDILNVLKEIWPMRKMCSEIKQLQPIPSKNLLSIDSQWRMSSS